MARQHHHPEVSLEWRDMRVVFRVVASESGGVVPVPNGGGGGGAAGGEGVLSSDTNNYEIFPTLDPHAPSARSLSTWKKRRQTKEAAGGSTLTSYLGLTLTREQPAISDPDCDRRSVASSGSRGSGGTSGSNSSSSGVSLAHRATGGPSRRECRFCGRSFSKASYLKRHLRSAHLKKSYKCSLCRYSFFQQGNLKKHMASAHPEADDTDSGLSCHFCDIPLASREALVAHCREVHGVAVPKKELKEHQDAKQQQLTTKSSGKVKAKATLPPAAARGKNGGTWSQCQICGKTFLTLANLVQHMHLHQTQKAFGCCFCGQRFSQKAFLQKHLSTAHPEMRQVVKGEPHLFACPKCNENFDSTEHLSEHLANCGGAPGEVILPSSGASNNKGAENLDEEMDEEDDEEEDIDDVEEEEDDDEEEIADDEEEIEAPLICGAGAPSAAAVAAALNMDPNGVPVISSPLPPSDCLVNEVVDARRFQCTMCDESFEKALAFNDHLFNAHPVEIAQRAALNSGKNSKRDSTKRQAARPVKAEDDNSPI